MKFNEDARILRKEDRARLKNTLSIAHNTDTDRCLIREYLHEQNPRVNRLQELVYLGLSSVGVLAGTGSILASCSPEYTQTLMPGIIEAYTVPALAGVAAGAFTTMFGKILRNHVLSENYRNRSLEARENQACKSFAEIETSRDRKAA